MRDIVTTKVQLDQLMNDTMIYAVIVFIISLGLAFLISSLIPWEGGKDKSYIKRRVVFILIGIVSVLAFWLYNDLVVASNINSAGFKNMFKASNLKLIVITAGGYFIVGLIIMFAFRNSKFGSILGRIKK